MMKPVNPVMGSNQPDSLIFRGCWCTQDLRWIVLYEHPAPFFKFDLVFCSDMLLD